VALEDHRVRSAGTEECRSVDGRLEARAIYFYLLIIVAKASALVSRPSRQMGRKESSVQTRRDDAAFPVVLKSAAQNKKGPDQVGALCTH
jgi:hypothetical protein